MEIKKVNIAEIKPYFNNPRVNDNAIPKVMESIKRYGFIKPIIVDRDGVIIAGHTRYLAAFRLGMTTVPVVYSSLDEQQAMAYRILDNKLAEKSSWDTVKLSEELKGMDVPEEMQAFFFEDIKSIIDIGHNDFAAMNDEGMYGDDDDDESGPDETQSVEELAKSEGIEVVDVTESQDSSDNQENGGEHDEHDATGAPVINNVINVPYEEDGVKWVNMRCPYCGSIEKIKLD